ncbi:hypothetical protein, partial [Xenorhabdus sp. SGI240]|uniref:hypothetical protein n=1 Tax=Xenorhabdus sp. SGI240 TaxID=3158262 RepID=UPI0032B76A6C
MPKHIHADLITEYARLSHITDRPWEYFEIFAFGEWEPCINELRFKKEIKYRLKPRTIKIGDIEVPEPVREPLVDGANYYYPNISYGEFNCNSRPWSGSVCDKDRLSSGLIHLDRESAELHAKALIALTAK